MTSATVTNLLADLRVLANVGEYGELRDAMEGCLRPHERAGFAELLARMRDNYAVAVELYVRARDAAAVLQSKASDGEQETIRRLYAVLSRAGGET